MAKATSNVKKANPTAKKDTDNIKKETRKKSAKVSGDVTEQTDSEENVAGADISTSTAVKEEKVSTRGRKKKEVSEPDTSDSAVDEKPKKRARISKPVTEQVVIPEVASDEDDMDDDPEETDDEVKPRARRTRRQKADSISIGSSSHAITLEQLDKSNIWTLDEQELFDIYIEGRKHDSFSENEVHYMNIIRPVFEMAFFDFNNKDKKREYEGQGFYIFPTVSTNTANAMAIRRRPIKKIMDLTLENVHHIDPKTILKLIDDNMGTGWQGLPLAIQDIISAAFYVDCSVMPEFALHRPGGIIEKRIESGYEVLEIPRGSWIEAVFIKVKPKQEKLHFEAIPDKPVKKKKEKFSDEDEDEDYDDEDEDIEDDNLEDEEEDFEDENEEPDEASIELEDIDIVDSDSDDDE